MVSPRLRLVLEILVRAGRRGCSDHAFVSRFLPELLELVRQQLATAEREITIVRGRPFDFVRVEITDEGRRIFEDCLGPREPVDSPDLAAGIRWRRLRVGGCQSARRETFSTARLRFGNRIPLLRESFKICERRRDREGIAPLLLPRSTSG